MYILAIETTGPVGSVAVIDAERGRPQDPRVPMKVTTRAMSHLRNLIPMAAALLEEEHIDKDEICAVAASCGPGSFTGIRIGVSTARALSQAWGVPCISVPTLELFREKCGQEGAPEDAGCSGGAEEGPSESGEPEEAAAGKEADGSVLAIFNARRGQVYGACYGRDGSAFISPGPYMLEDMLDKIEELGIAPTCYGDGVDAYFDKEEFRDRTERLAQAPADDRYQTAGMAARYALDVWNGDDPEGRITEADKLLPDYMRESEAEQRLRDGSLERMRKARMEKFMKMAGKRS